MVRKYSTENHTNTGDNLPIFAEARRNYYAKKVDRIQIQIQFHPSLLM